MHRDPRSGRYWGLQFEVQGITGPSEVPSRDCKTIWKRPMLSFNNSITFKIQRAKQLWDICSVEQKKQNWHPLEVSLIQMVNQSLVQNQNRGAYWIKTANQLSPTWVSWTVWVLLSKIGIKMNVQCYIVNVKSINRRPHVAAKGNCIQYVLSLSAVLTLKIDTQGGRKALW